MRDKCFYINLKHLIRTTAIGDYTMHPMLFSADNPDTGDVYLCCLLDDGTTKVQFSYVGIKLKNERDTYIKLNNGGDFREMFLDAPILYDVLVRRTKPTLAWEVDKKRKLELRDRIELSIRKREKNE